MFGDAITELTMGLKKNNADQKQMIWAVYEDT